MQSKGVIKFFAIAFALVCLFQLSFTFVTRSIEKDAREYARNAQAERLAGEVAGGDEVRFHFMMDSLAKVRERYYLDSVSSEEVFNILLRRYTYQECKERELNLGLDLKGGMNVTLSVSVVDIIRSLSGYSDDPTFNQAISMALEKQKSSNRNFVSLFAESFTEIDPDARLAAIFTTIELKDRVTPRSTNEEVIEILRTEADQAFGRTLNILRTRIDRFGVAQPNIQALEQSGRILVELPGIKEPERVRKLLQGSANLEFWETYEFGEIQSYFGDANTKLKSILDRNRALEPEEEASPDTLALTEDPPAMAEAEAETDMLNDTLASEDTGSSLLDQLSDTSGLGADQELSQAEWRKENPLYAVLNPAYFQDESGQFFAGQGPVVGYALIRDTGTVNTYLSMVRTVFPRDLKMAWTVKPNRNQPDVLQLVALKVTSRDGTPPLDGDAIVDARQDYNMNGQVEISMSMNSDGARTWKRLTGDNIGKSIAIVLDDYVYSFPTVNDEIPSGRSSITGNFTVEEAKDLANILKAGKLPAPARIVQEEVVGPSLGRESVTQGLRSFVLAFVLVLVYMIFYYSRAGMIADLALVSNIFFIFGVLASLGAVLTLPGIAGIVLTIGMAVDANVIIFERVIEEIRAGKGIRLAISDGYKNAYSAIIDGNVTTLLTGIVLYTFGSGPVQGFATTLIIGILSSLFTAIFLTRLVFDWLLRNEKLVKFNTRITENAFTKVNFDFLKMRRMTYIISASIIMLGVLSLSLRGLNLGIDFTGGRTYIVRFDQPVESVIDVRKALSDEFGENLEVKTFGPSTQLKIVTKFMIDERSESVDSLVAGKLYTALLPYYNNPIDKAHFLSDVDDQEHNLGILQSQKVGPTIASDIKRNAVMAIIFALIVIFIYIAVRFRRWQFGLSGVAALFHDSLITISLFSMFYNLLPFNMEIDQAFIAAILTIIGYSINDTVIIFDRIREFIGLHPKKDLKDNINNALNSTLGRTFNTSGTTLLVLLMIFFFGGEIIRGFTFALAMGIVIGTYSSLFTASPIAYDLITWQEKKKALKKKK